MPFENKIDIDHLQLADHCDPATTVGDIRALVTVLDAATSHLLLPDEATQALERLRKLIDSRGCS